VVAVALADDVLPGGRLPELDGGVVGPDGLPPEVLLLVELQVQDRLVRAVLDDDPGRGVDVACAGCFSN